MRDPDFLLEPGAHLKVATLTRQQLASIGLTCSPMARPSSANAGSESPLYPYFQRDIDKDLPTSGHWLLIRGPDASGKTRTAYGALSRTTGDRVFLAPRPQPHVREVVEAALEQLHVGELGGPSAVIWLDNLETFLASGGFDDASDLIRLGQHRGAVSVVMILSDWHAEHYLHNYRLRQLASDPRVSTVRLEAATSRTEYEDAARLYDALPPWTSELSLPRYFAGLEGQLNAYRAIPPDSLTRAVVDVLLIADQIGTEGGISRDALQQMVMAQIPSAQSATAGEIGRALAMTCQSTDGSGAPLVRELDSDRFQVSAYLASKVAEEPSTLDPLWRLLAPYLAKLVLADRIQADPILLARRLAEIRHGPGDSRRQRLEGELVEAVISEAPQESDRNEALLNGLRLWDDRTLAGTAIGLLQRAVQSGFPLWLTIPTASGESQTEQLNEVGLLIFAAEAELWHGDRNRAMAILDEASAMLRRRNFPRLLRAVFRRANNSVTMRRLRQQKIVELYRIQPRPSGELSAALDTAVKSRWLSSLEAQVHAANFGSPNAVSLRESFDGSGLVALSSSERGLDLIHANALLNQLRLGRLSDIPTVDPTHLLRDVVTDVSSGAKRDAVPMWTSPLLLYASFARRIEWTNSNVVVFAGSESMMKSFQASGDLLIFNPDSAIEVRLDPIPPRILPVKHEGRLQVGSHEVAREGAVSARPDPPLLVLEELIRLQDVPGVQRQLGVARIYALGHTAGDTSVPGFGTESTVLHFTLEGSDGAKRTLLPIFTRSTFLAEAMKRNPEWQTLSVLLMEGKALLASVDPDVTIVLNPWSELECQIPAKVDREP